MRMTTSELVHAAYHAARYLPKASSQLMRDLAERLDTTQAALCESLKIREALAAENAALKNAISCHAAGFTVCEACGEENISGNDDVCRALNETPVTDAFLAEVRASELDSLAGVAETMLVKFANQNASQIPEAKGWEMIQRQASHRAAQLRGTSNGGAL